MAEKKSRMSECMCQFCGCSTQREAEADFQVRLAECERQKSEAKMLTDFEKNCVKTMLENAYAQGKRDALKEARKVVDAQSLDDGLWFSPVYLTEDYLQKALRKLHEAIEGRSPEECAADVLPMLRGDANV